MPTLMYLNYKWMFVALCALLTLSANVFADTVRIARSQTDIDKLPDTLLTQALKRGGIYSPSFPYGDIESLPLSTRINGVRNKEFDIFHGLSTPEYEQEFIPVYIPIYRGMMGMRLAILHASKRNIFKHVKNINDLKKYTAGQGRFWADSKILEANDIPLVKELKYENLFRMLEAERFDYFPRGIHEPWAEIKRWDHLSLQVDPYLLLWYKVPFYFFVHKSNQKLANHLTEQLEAMIADGSYDELFFKDSDIQMALNNAHIDQRVIIKMDNPFLSDKTPIHRDELWFDLNTISANNRQAARNIQ